MSGVTPCLSTLFSTPGRSQADSAIQKFIAVVAQANAVANGMTVERGGDLEAFIVAPAE